MQTLCRMSFSRSGCASLVGNVTDPSRAQVVAVWLAFVAAAFSLLAVALTFTRTGRIEATPLFGGLLMLALGLAGRAKLKRG